MQTKNRYLWAIIVNIPMTLYSFWGFKKQFHAINSMAFYVTGICFLVFLTLLILAIILYLKNIYTIYKG